MITGVDEAYEASERANDEEGAGHLFNLLHSTASFLLEVSSASLRPMDSSL